MSCSTIFRRTAWFTAACAIIPAAAMAQEPRNSRNNQLDSSRVIEEIIITTEIQSYRGGVPLEETPQAVQIMSGDFLSNMGITELSNALDLSGGIARQNNFGGVWNSFAIRGFAGDENVPSGYLINGFAAGRGFSGLRDATNIERIEIMKGPGSALFGRSEPGGTINIVTKKPQFEEEGYWMVSAGSYDKYRLEGDYTNALSDTVAYRINGSYEDAESFRDTVTTEKYSVTPSIVWLPSDSTTISYELELLRQEIPFDRGVVAINNKLGALPVSRFLGEPNDGPMEIEATGHQFLIQHNLDENWSIIGALGYRESSLKGYSSDTELAGSRQLLFTDGQTLNRQRRHRDYQTEDTSARLELSGDIEVGGFTHHLLMGFDAYTFEFDSPQNRWRPAAGDTTYTINVFNPVYGQASPTLTPLSHKFEEQEAWGVYLQNQIDLTDQWRIMAGIRFDDFSKDITDKLSGGKSSQSQTAVNPRVGVVYELSPTSSIYVSYSEGFRPNSGSNWKNDAFDPEESKSYEVGAKFATEDGRISGTVALFKAEKSNIITSDPVHSGFSEALGEAESSGVEIDVSGELTDDLYAWFSYAYVDAHTSNDVINADWGVGVPAGTQLVNVPEHSASVSLVKDFLIADKASSAGVSVQYVDERPGDTINPDYWLPDYTLVKFFGSYRAMQNLDLKLEVSNLFDEEYYPNSYSALWTSPGESRTFMVKARYAF